MQKYDVMGHEMVKVRDIRHAIRKLRKGIKVTYKNFDKEKQAMVHLAYNDVVRQLYQEELKAAKTPEEIKAVLEMPGDFIVYKRDGKKKFAFFEAWDSGKAVITDRPYRCMTFDYESKAEEVAESLGEGWMVLDASPEAHRDTVRLWRAIFGETDDEPETKGEE